MSKRYIHLSIKIIIVYITLSSSLINPVNAWKNGSYANNSIDYDFDKHYGTHDWIADYALDELIKRNTSGWQWLDNRKTIFFLGTEAPDNAGINIILDGTNIDGFGDTTHHHIYFNEDGTIKNNEDDSAIRAKWCGDWADVALYEGEYDKAAFYLGAMAHYIGDMGMFAHVAPNNVLPYEINFDEHHSTIEGYVNTRSNEHDDKAEFFNISSINVNSIKPYNAAVQVSWDTYKDPTASIGNEHGAFWLHNNYFTGWAQTLASRNVETNQTKIAYYNRFEDCLENAISGVASAMNYICNSRIKVENETETSSEIHEKRKFKISGFPIINFCILVFGISLLLIKNKNSFR